MVLWSISRWPLHFEDLTCHLLMHKNIHYKTSAPNVEFLCESSLLHLTLYFFQVMVSMKMDLRYSPFWHHIDIIRVIECSKSCRLIERMKPKIKKLERNVSSEVYFLIFGLVPEVLINHIGKLLVAIKHLIFFSGWYSCCSEPAQKKLYYPE